MSQTVFRQMKVLGFALLLMIVTLNPDPASAECDTNIGGVNFPQISVIGNGSEYTEINALGYSWSAKLDVTCGVFGRVTDWEILPIVHVNGIGYLVFGPYSASSSYHFGQRPKQVHWNDSVFFNSAFVKSYAVAACNFNADVLREEGFSDTEIFSKEHKVALKHWMLANVGYSNTREVGHVGYFGPGPGEIICKKFEGPQVDGPDELESDTEMKLLGASLVLFPIRYEGMCPSEMTLFVRVHGNVNGKVEVWIESTAGWQSDKGVIETSRFDPARGNWVGETDGRLAVPILVSSPPPGHGVPTSPTTDLILPPNDPGGGALPPGPDWSPDLSAEGLGGNVHTESLRLVARAGTQTIASDWQGYSYKCDPKPAIGVPSNDLTISDKTP